LVTGALREERPGGSLDHSERGGNVGAPQPSQRQKRRGRDGERPRQYASPYVTGATKVSIPMSGIVSGRLVFTIR